MRIAILGSGSKGNCLVVDGGGTVVLVDVGFAPREVRRRLQHLGLDLGDIQAIVITHAHGDHIKGASQLAGSLGLATYATEATKRFASTWTSLKRHVPVIPGDAFAIGGLRISPTKTCHDEPGSVCYAIDDGDEAFGICTDLGLVDDAVAAGLRNVDTLMLEFNHDRHMLQTGPYPQHLKRRVGSRYGHLNNDDAARLLSMTATPSLSRLLCAHLSEVNNTPDKALTAARTVLDGRDVEVAVAPQHAPTGWLRVRPRARASGEHGAVSHTVHRSTRSADIVDAATASAALAARPPESHAAAPRVGTRDPLTSPTTTAAHHLPLREVVRERQMRLFGTATATSTTATTADACRSKERP